MAINFPTSLDNFTNPSSGNTLDSPSHSLQHSDINDAVEAMQRKVGVGSAVAGSASAGQVLTISAAGTSTWVATGLTQIIPSSIAVGSGSGSTDLNGKVTFTGVSSVSLNDVFNATYESYRLVFSNIVASTSANLLFRFRVSGADNATDYYYGGISVNDTGAPAVTVLGSNTAQTSALLGSITTQVHAFDMFVGNPFLTATSQYSVMEGNGSRLLMGKRDSNVSFTGFTILTSTGTVSGSISVFGYR